MSLGALELASLFRKYTGQLADIDLNEADSKREYGQVKRDLGQQRTKNKRTLSNQMATQGLSNSGISLTENTDLEKAYNQASADADAQQKANLTRLAKMRLSAKGDYDEGVALSKMTQLLNKTGM